MSARNSGRGPSNRLPSRSSIRNLLRLINDGGIPPLSWFHDRLSQTSEGMSLLKDGIGPLNWFLSSHRSVTAGRFHNAGGMGPLN